MLRETKLWNVEQQSVAGNRHQSVCMLLLEIRMRKSLTATFGLVLVKATEVW